MNIKQLTRSIAAASIGRRPRRTRTRPLPFTRNPSLLCQHWQQQQQQPNRSWRQRAHTSLRGHDQRPSITDRQQYIGRWRRLVAEWRNDHQTFMSRLFDSLSGEASAMRGADNPHPLSILPLLSPLPPLICIGGWHSLSQIFVRNAADFRVEMIAAFWSLWSCDEVRALISV